MTRISTLAANTLLLNQALRTQQRVLDGQVAVSSEKKSQDYQGIATDSRRLVNVENTAALLGRYVKNNEQEDVRLEVAETVVESIRTSIRDFRGSLATFSTFESKNSEKVQDIQDEAFRALVAIQDYLNTEIDGRYIFSGARVSTKPVEMSLSTVSAFQTKYDGARTTYPTTRDAHLEDFTINNDTNNLNKKHITSTNFLEFRQDSDGDATTSGSSTIAASSAMFSNVSAGTLITVANSTNNNGSYTVSSVSSDGRTITINTEMFTDEAAVATGVITYPDPSDPTKNLEIIAANYGTLSFTRSSDTMTAATASSLSALAVDTQFTISGTTQNNGTYTVKSNDGTNIVIDAVKLTDEGTTSANSAGNAFFDYYSDTDIEFVSGTRTIEVCQSGTATSVPDIFNGLVVGNTFTIAGTASNNGTFTIASIATDGSSVTVSEAITNETDTTGATITGAASVPYSYTSGTRMVFTDVGAAGTDTIQLQDNAGAALTNGFENLIVGQTLTVTGTAAHNSTYTITAISGDKSTVTVAEDITATATDTDGARIQVFSVSGSVSASSYYDGDEIQTAHRVSSDRSFLHDVTAVDPAFEKAIRAMGIILQGQYGTEGGLDRNDIRVDQALYLLDSAQGRTVSKTPPTGLSTELDGNIQEVQMGLGFDRVLLSDTNKVHNALIGFYESSIADMENQDPLEAITRLLDDQRVLEASFQTFARIRQLSLTNFI